MSPGASVYSSPTASQTACTSSGASTSPPSSTAPSASVRVRVLAHRLVPELDGVDPARHLYYRGVVEMGREPLGIDRRRGDYHPQVRPRRQEPLKVTEDEIDVEAALVSLVDDDRVVTV